MLRSGVHHELYHEILDTMEALRCPIEGLHTETGPGVIEAALRYDGALEAADRAAIFKTFLKILVQRRKLMATFMAKWSSAYPGQSGHIHVSLIDKKGQNVFYDDKAPHGMSELMRHFVAGQLAYMPDVLAMVCSTVNSYRRLVPGMWAPVSVSWGIENRTTALRVIEGGAKAQRVEYRMGPADANPYCALAAAIATGLRGIEEKLELPDPVVGNAATSTVKGPAIPTSLDEAARNLARSKVARELFGDTFVDHYAATRDWEVRENRKWVSDWDLARYFEII